MLQQCWSRQLALFSRWRHELLLAHLSVRKPALIHCPVQLRLCWDPPFLLMWQCLLACIYMHWFRGSLILFSGTHWTVTNCSSWCFIYWRFKFTLVCLYWKRILISSHFIFPKINLTSFYFLQKRCFWWKWMWTLKGNLGRVFFLFIFDYIEVCFPLVINTTLKMHMHYQGGKLRILWG